MGARNIVRLLGEGLKASEEFDLGSGESLSFVPEVDDQGSIIVGSATKAMDLKWYGVTATAIATFDAGTDTLNLAGVAVSSNTTIATTGAVTVGSLGVSGALKATGDGFVGAKKLVTEATATRAVAAADFDSIVELTGGAGATTATLPAPAADNLGAKITFVSLSNHAHVVALADKIVGLTDVAASSLTAAEANKTGQTVTLVSDGAKWVVVAMTGAWTVGA